VVTNLPVLYVVLLWVEKPDSNGRKTIMEQDHKIHLVPFFSGLVIGAVIGAGVALTFAPSSGKKTRRQVQKAAEHLKDAAEDRWDEATESVRERAESVRRRFF